MLKIYEIYANKQWYEGHEMQSFGIHIQNFFCNYIRHFGNSNLKTLKENRNIYMITKKHEVSIEFFF